MSTTMMRKLVRRTVSPVLVGALVVGAAWTVATSGRLAHADPPIASAAEGVVNLNTATPAQLQLLPGIGESRARAIIEVRQRRPFARVEDVVGVRGIGRATLRRLRPYLSIRGETTLTRAVRGVAPPPASRTPVAAPRDRNVPLRR